MGWWSLLGCVVLLVAAWYLRGILILVFGAVLIAAILHAFAAPLSRATGLSRRPAIAIVLVAILAVTSAAVWWIGSPLVTQLASLAADLPHGWESVSNWLGDSPVGSRLLSAMHDLSSDPPVAGIANATATTLQMLSGVVLILLMGVYLAFDVSLYVNGLVRLFPVSKRFLIRNTLDDAGKSLTRWLTGQGVTMLVVGIVASVGLLVLAIPLALALGFIAGVLEFVPFFGPIASGLLAVLVAFAQGPRMALYVGLFFLVVVQQLEGNVLVPVVQRWAVKLPPLLSVAAVVVFGTIFGIPGIVFGTPLMVVAIVMVRHLWIEAVLEKTPDEAERVKKTGLPARHDGASATR